jgi:hypothetical protein
MGKSEAADDRKLRDCRALWAEQVAPPSPSISESKDSIFCGLRVRLRRKDLQRNQFVTEIRESIRYGRLLREHC